MLTIDAHVDFLWVLTKYGKGASDLSEWSATKRLDNEVFAVYLSKAWREEHGLKHVDQQLSCLDGDPFAIEGAHLLGDYPIKRLKEIVRGGQVPKYLTLTHNQTNDIADSATDKPKHGGLSDLGFKLVDTCRQLGVHVDVSHASDATIDDCLDSGPVIASHSGCRTLCDQPRNIDDYRLERMAKHDGSIVCIPFVTKFLGDATFHDHVAHAVKIGGSTFVGVGSDLDGAALVPAFLKTMDWEGFVTEGLREKGLAEKQIEEIAGYNLGILFDL